MQLDENLLHIISNETKSSIDQMSIVTPTVYKSIFSKYATDHNQTLENESEIAEHLIKAECENLTKLQEDTSKNAIQLSNSTDKAIGAIKNKDEKTLTEVLKETNNLKKEIEKLKEAVYKDELTRAYNRKWLLDTYLDGDNKNFLNDGTLVMIDLNYFKQVNDTHGHIIGDKVLIYIANELRKSKQNVIRYGGDEFILIFPHSTLIKNALNSLHKIREMVISKKLKAHENTFTVSFSYGGTEFKKGDNLQTIIEFADKKMYTDKIKIKRRVKGI